jgi:phosphoglycolate phosphatase-like HAD superfamily hydrolase
MGMARSAGAIGIGAGWGYHDDAELLAGGAAAVAESPLDVARLLKRVGAAIDG